jgi:hypothetical protein
MVALLVFLLGLLVSQFRPVSRLVAENAALRHQLMYALTDSGRATLAVILKNAGLAPR